jgi:peptidoglycan/LPS O-acetylase OafA/YrhL
MENRVRRIYPGYYVMCVIGLIMIIGDVIDFVTEHKNKFFR